MNWDWIKTTLLVWWNIVVATTAVVAVGYIIQFKDPTGMHLVGLIALLVLNVALLMVWAGYYIGLRQEELIRYG